MQEAASSVLIGRSREIDGVGRMITVSMVAHGLVMTALVLAPRAWFMASIEPEPKRMMVSLGGPQGADTGGMTSIANRTIQEEAATNKIAPPAKAPAMALPEPTVKPVPVKKPTDKPADKPATKQSTGPQLKTGPARVETGGADVPFGGLASSSGGMGGARVEGDFCCPEYIQTMQRLIRSNWNQQQGAAGVVEVKFIIRRDGMITNVEVSRSSNNPLLDLESRRAVIVTQRLPPLPEKYTLPSLTVYVIFEFKR